MLFQIIALILIALIVGRIALQYRRQAISGKEFLFWSLFWVLAAAGISVPNALTFLANALGIGRGTDLAFYASFVIVGFMLFRMVVRMDKMERDVTKVVRHLALKNDELGMRNEGTGESSSSHQL
ncbi:hypothetical protein A3J43_03370 [Candidatus Uhrbacteria bacterium RIFCSPHIGHO2_12_FULL_54_23]|uniref:DUF2304 domain-containing protein n=3 Tax=Candidatus Uhriibacteriota TaxID=1752732 RepID=A0A1F7UN64_9BACT|nr:MAG: hypothetical protein A3J43_03370 [Candidatus Uhrbacteria bacterium RIFCSPHIGHO2_12_FULL_54_23]OGL85625.1 MAG: hypothetical protein A3B36_01870 [Candidatus Uhrbacteria bacterium RIFCSPLOWO2_01_FULL_55_36]OGL91135.1 MAG: hypothetical protein A3J36_03060 [Candidatus Uhrbacteria bacterium RIFCSPLOWO2_02_FULL_54_37]